jgi:predicted transcriptional regulator
MKTIEVSDEMFERLQKLASSVMDSEEYADAYSDAASWGNVDDSMAWYGERCEEFLAREILKGAKETE